MPAEMARVEIGSCSPVSATKRSTASSISFCHASNLADWHRHE
jgi:hypothetical protein